MDYEQREQVIGLYSQGKTYQEIGSLLLPPVSRQRVHQIFTGYRPPSKVKPKKPRIQRIPPTKEEIREQHRKYRHKIKLDVLTHYGNGMATCLHCGFGDIRALSIDHIIGNRGKPRPNDMYRWLIRNNYPEGYQTLCFNCQWIKRDKEGETR